MYLSPPTPPNNIGWLAGPKGGNIYKNCVVCHRSDLPMGCLQPVSESANQNPETLNPEVWDPKPRIPKDAYGLWLQCNYLLAC